MHKVFSFFSAEPGQELKYPPLMFSSFSFFSVIFPVHYTFINVPDLGQMLAPFEGLIFFILSYNVCIGKSTRVK